MSKLFRHFEWVQLLLVLALFSGFPSELSATSPDNVKKILILHSYDPAYPRTLNQMTGIQEVFSAADANLQIQVEYLDTKRYHKPEYLNTILETVFEYKLRHRSYDLVLTTDDDALNFVLKYRNDWFANTPVVFCGISLTNSALPAETNQITGVREKPSFAETIELALRLHPDTNELIFVGCPNNLPGELARKGIVQTLPSISNQISITFWDHLHLEELQLRLKHLQPGKVLFIYGFICDQEDRVIPPNELGELVSNISPVPVYSFWDYMLGGGIVGGKMVSSKVQGALGAQLALRVLGGEPPEEIPVISVEANHYMFDYPVIKRFGIPRTDLPAESVVINQPEPFYHVEKTYLWIGVAMMAILVSTTLLLLKSLKLRKIAEKNLQATLREAESARDKINAIISSVADGLVVTDMTGRITMINKAAEELFNVSEEQVLSHTVDILTENESFQELLVNLRKIPQTPVHALLEISDSSFKKGRSVQARGSIVLRKDGTPSGAAIILRDVTQEKIADRMKNEFISTAAHELRTPLTAVIGYAELLVDDFIQTPLNIRQKQEFAEHILHKAECLEKITNDLLDVGRLETGRPIALEKSRHDLAQLIWDTVRPFTVETTRHNFAVELSEENLFLDFDKSKLTQVLDNLLSNAIKYSPQGGTVHIESQTNPEGEVAVSVADQGIGMTDEQAEKVFDKFYRADNSNTAVGGLGLGLGIAKGIIEAHGGRILVESQYGSGTRVTFFLPNP